MRLYPLMETQIDDNMALISCGLMSVVQMNEDSRGMYEVWASNAAQLGITYSIASESKMRESLLLAAEKAKVSVMTM